MKTKYVDQKFMPIEVVVTLETKKEYETLLEASEQLLPSRINDKYVDRQARQMIHDLISCLAGSAKKRYENCTKIFS